MKLRAHGVVALLCLSLGALALAQAPPVAGTIVYSRSGSTEGTIWMAAGDGSSDTPIAAGEWPAVSPDKHWIAYHGVYASGSSAPHSNIFVRQLPVGVDTLVYSFTSDSANYYSFAPDSSKLYYDAITDINAVNVAGTTTQTIVSNGDAGFDDVPIIRLSDGAFAFQDVNAGLGIANFDGSNKQFIPNTRAGDAWPQWSADEAWLSFTPFTGGNIFKIHPDGSGRTQLSFLTVPGDAFQFTAPWTPDGKFVVAAGTVNGVNGLYAVATDGSGSIVKIPTTPGAPIEFVGGVIPAAAAVADLAVTPSSSSGSVIAGTPVNYSFPVTNNGPASAPNVLLGIVMPAGMTLNSSTLAACTPSGQVIICPLGPIAANASITVTITATTSVVGTAVVSGVVNYDGADPNPIIISLNSTQSTVTTVGTFSPGSVVSLAATGSACLASSSDWCTFADGTLVQPVVSSNWALANIGAAYPTTFGGDGVNHYWLGGANYDPVSAQFGVAGAASTDTTNPATIRLGSVAGAFTTSPAAADYFLIGKSTALRVGASPQSLYAQVNDCPGCFFDNSGSFSLIASRDFLAADPNSTNNSAFTSTQITAASTVAVTISPTAVTLLTGMTQQFTAGVTGATDTSVTWSVSGAGCTGTACGTVSSSGLYTAPSAALNPNTVTVTATSVADNSKATSATVTVISAGAACLGGAGQAIFATGPAPSTTFRSANSGPGQGISVATTTTINTMAMFLAMPSGGNIKYMIWDDTNSNLLFSQVVPVAASNTMSWVLSQPFSFTLTAGRTYWFGVIADNSVNVGFISPTITISQNGLTALTNNSNYSNFTSPTNVGGGGAQIGLQLFSGCAPTLVADYQFANVHTSSVGEVPALVDIGLGTNSFTTDTVRGASQTVLVFPQGNGLQLSPTTGLFANAVYTVAALVRLDTNSGFRRILDFKNASSDTGLYNLNGALNFFNVTTGSSAPIAAGAYVQIVLTRAVDGTVTGYVNGVQQISFADSSGLAVIDGANVLRFFKDDNAVPNENSGGAVARIRIWNGALTASQVAALESGTLDHFAVSPATSTPSAGVAFSVTVTAQDAFNSTVTGYTGTVHFSLTNPDAGATLPADYTFVAGDNGTHTFTSGVSLTVVGAQSLNVNDTVQTVKAGSVAVTVSGQVDLSVSAGTSSLVSFDPLAATLVDFNPIPVNYGSTPQVTVSYATEGVGTGGVNVPNISWWGTGYGDLNSAGFAVANGFFADVYLTGLNGSTVTLNGFDISGYPQVDKPSETLQVYADGSLVHDYSPFTALGAGPTHSHVTPGATGNVVRLRWGIDWNAGINNITFTSGAPSTMLLGAAATITPTVFNNSPTSTATGVSLSYTVPAGLAFVSATSATMSCTSLVLEVGGTAVTCTQPSLAPNTAASAAISVRAAATGTITNTVTVSGNETDPNSANNTTSFNIQVVPAADALTVSTSGAGSGTVTSNPAGISCPGTCTFSFTQGTSVSLTPAAPAGSAFAGWGGACSGTGACSVTMNAAQSVSATFNLTTVTVTGAGTGNGTVTGTGGISCTSTAAATSGTCTNTSPISSGDVVTLSATPASSQSVFAGWSGACSGSGACTFTMGTSAVTATATFSPGPSADLSVSVVPAGGSAATVTVTNLGPANATNVVLTDTLDRFGFVSATPSQGGPCTFAASVVTCPLGSLAAGASATVTMVVTAPSQGWAAQILKAISALFDPNPTNNAARVGPALSSFNTPTGANVVVSATDSSGDAATVSFASVTRVGSTTIAASVATSAAPAGYRFGTPAIIYDISSNADFTVPITVALRFNPAWFHHPGKVRLFHFENGFWVDRTTGVNLAAGTVSAVTSTLSPFIVVEPLNNPPVANAGAAQALAGLSATGTAVKLDATSSSDADGDALTYRWSGPFPEGNGVVTGATPTVTLPLGTSTVNLIVNDGENDSAAAVSVTVADFLVAANSAAMSVKRGQSATLTVAVSPKFAAYGEAVALSCPNLPSGVTCSFSPAAIAPGANGAAATLTITATASVARVSGPGSGRRAPPLLAFWFAIIAPFGLVWTTGLTRRRTVVALALMIVLLIALVACGGGGITSNANSQPPPTPSSTVTITVTGTSSSLQHSTTVPLTLQ